MHMAMLTLKKNPDILVHIGLDWNVWFDPIASDWLVIFDSIRFLPIDRME